MLFSLTQLLHDFFGLRGVYLASNSLHEVRGQRKSCPCLNLYNFEQIQWNKLFHRIYGLAVNLIMTLSGHLSNIDEIRLLTVWPEQSWTKGNGWWQILPQHQSTDLRDPESASFEIPPFRPHFIFSKLFFMK